MAFENIDEPLSDHEISRMKSQARQMLKKRDSLAIQVAKILNLPSIWTLNDVNWEDPRVHDLGEQIFQYDIDLCKLNKEISKQQAIRDGELDYYNAKEKAYQFIEEHFTNFDEEVEFYRKNNMEMGISTFTDRLYHNPDYITEVII